MFGRLRLRGVVRSFPAGVVIRIKMSRFGLRACSQMGGGVALAFGDMIETESYIHAIGGKGIE